MKIAVCVKEVPDAAVTKRIDQSTKRLDRSGEGALNHFEDHDELFWNAIGTEWSVPIDHGETTVTATADITQVACFSGPVRSTLPCANATSSGNTATFSQGNIPPNAALTVVVGAVRTA